MSNQQRVSHITGLNTDQSNALPFAGSYYQVQGGGAPGILGGISAGFTVAVALKAFGTDGSVLPWTAAGDPTRREATPDEEFVCGAVNASDIESEGWSILIDEGSFMQGIDQGGAGFTIEINPGGDVIMVITRVADPSLYDPGEGTTPQLSAGINNYIRTDQEAAQDPYVPGGDFYIGGAPDLSGFNAPEDGDIGGLVNSSLSGVWITPGIPDYDQLADFMLACTQAGEIVPAAWPGVRTASNLTPETPALPTGHYFNARDINPNDGLGGTWIDRIGGVILERVGIISGNERVLARDPFFANIATVQS